MTSSGVEQPAGPRHGRRRFAAGWRRRFLMGAYALRVVPDGWEDADRGTLTKPALTVIGAWMVLAWSRFGPQPLVDVRALARFVLVGVYGWLGLALGLWLLDRLHRERRPGLTLASLVRLVGLAHEPLLAAAVAVMVLQLIPSIGLRTVFAMTAVLVWMPGQLMAAVAHLERRPWHRVVATTLMTWLAWVATVGWFLLRRLSHVI